MNYQIDFATSQDTKLNIIFFPQKNLSQGFNGDERSSVLCLNHALECVWKSIANIFLIYTK